MLRLHCCLASTRDPKAPTLTQLSVLVTDRIDPLPSSRSAVQRDVPHV
jgi:hypothetical protein